MPGASPPAARQARDTDIEGQAACLWGPRCSSLRSPPKQRIPPRESASVSHRSGASPQRFRIDSVLRGGVASTVRSPKGFSRRRAGRVDGPRADAAARGAANQDTFMISKFV